MQHREHEDANTGNLPEEKLMAYLEGRLVGDELREVELLLAGEGMEADALEGLEELDAATAEAMTASLNQQLGRALKKSKRRRRRGMAEQKWSWMALVIILLLAVAGFAVLWLLRQAA